VLKLHQIRLIIYGRPGAIVTFFYAYLSASFLYHYLYVAKVTLKQMYNENDKSMKLNQINSISNDTLSK